MPKRMPSQAFPAILLASAVTIGVGEWSSVAAQQAPFRWQGRLAAGQTIEVRGINGDIRATGVSGAMVEVTAVKQARRSRIRSESEAREWRTPARPADGEWQHHVAAHAIG